ncbi:hypothetical protein Barb4_01736 [Bacteroidales bacterium Barb4]|nr:hypothetical protein Barb4_01736 [Bacteroidales bacterium Barb4]
MYRKDNGISCIGMIVVADYNSIASAYNSIAAAACNSIMVALVICAFKDIALVF